MSAAGFDIDLPAFTSKHKSSVQIVASPPECLSLPNSRAGPCCQPCRALVFCFASKQAKTSIR